MTVKSDLQKALSSCEEVRGSYAKMAQSTHDQMAKQTFGQMKADMDRHVMFLSDRLEYLNVSNRLNQDTPS
ncbi:MAG: DUF1657 domain-containing protein [Bacillota bacterium]